MEETAANTRDGSVTSDIEFQVLELGIQRLLWIAPRVQTKTRGCSSIGLHRTGVYLFYTDSIYRMQYFVYQAYQHACREMCRVSVPSSVGRCCRIREPVRYLGVQLRSEDGTCRPDDIAVSRARRIPKYVFLLFHRRLLPAVSWRQTPYHRWFGGSPDSSRTIANYKKDVGGSRGKGRERQIEIHLGMAIIIRLVSASGHPVISRKVFFRMTHGL